MFRTVPCYLPFLINGRGAVCNSLEDKLRPIVFHKEPLLHTRDDRIQDNDHLELLGLVAREEEDV